MKRFTFFTGCILSSALLLGCSSSGVSQAEYDQLQSNYESVVAELESYKNQAVEETPVETSEPETESTPQYADLPDAATMVQMIKDANSNVGNTVIYDESTDPNELLGRPGEYIGKADFEDTRLEQVNINAGFENDYTGGTFEIFSSSDDCQKRYDYLLSLRDPSMGAYGLNEYMYKYDCVLFRVDYALTPEQAQEYHDIFDSIMTNYQDISTQISD